VARTLGGEASNSVVVVDDLLLKTYRRVRAGVNAELDMLLFFAEHGFRHVPELAGWYAYEGERVQATLGLLQRFVPDAIDGWELGHHELASRPGRFLAQLEHLGAVVGEMHAVLASDTTDPAFAPEESTPESAGLMSARIDEEIDATFDELGDRDELARLVGLHHVCFRARSREDIDEAHRFVQALDVPIIRAPQEDGWAPGYYSLLFEDPDGVRLEINHVPGKGVFDTEEKAVSPVYPKSRP
jgi:predicted trehalose synthase